MPQFLYTVTEVFVMTGCGIIAVPGIPPETPSIRKGTPLELRRPMAAFCPATSKMLR